MKRFSFLALLIALALVGAACRQKQGSTPASEATASVLSPSPQSESPGTNSTAVARDDCELATEKEVEDIVGTDVTLSAGSCNYEAKEQQKGISGEWSVEEYNEASWNASKRDVGEQAEPGYGDEAYSFNSGVFAQMIVRKGDRVLVISCGTIAGNARDHLIGLANKLVPKL